MLISQCLLTRAAGQHSAVAQVFSPQIKLVPLCGRLRSLMPFWSRVGTPPETAALQRWRCSSGTTTPSALPPRHGGFTTHGQRLLREKTIPVAALCAIPCCPLKLIPRGARLPIQSSPVAPRRRSVRFRVASR